MDEPPSSVCLVRPPQSQPRMHWSGTSVTPLYSGHLSAALPEMSISVESTFVTPMQNADTLLWSLNLSSGSIDKLQSGVSSPVLLHLERRQRLSAVEELNRRILDGEAILIDSIFDRRVLSFIAPSDMCKIKKNTNKFSISPLVITATAAGSAYSKVLWVLAQPSHCLHHKDFNVSQRQSNSAGAAFSFQWETLLFCLCQLWRLWHQCFWSLILEHAPHIKLRKQRSNVCDCNNYNCCCQMGRTMFRLKG